MSSPSRFSPKPSWLKVRAPGGDTYQHLKQTFRSLDLHTVCEEARCPNVGECWGEGTATIMLLGDTCTRGCRFCAVKTGDPRGEVDVREPELVARAIARLELQYVVLTMVDRDDLLDGGAAHVGQTIRILRELRPDILIEALVGDFHGRHSDVDTIIDAGPAVYAHNIEVVRRITRKVRDVRCSYDQSLAVLRHAKEQARAVHGAESGTRLTKSSLMVGIGETDDEVIEAMRDLREAKVDIITIGQYLRPTPKHHDVERFVEPEAFAEYGRVARELGFLYAASGPLVRSSYHAAEVFLRSVLSSRTSLGADPPGFEEGIAQHLNERRATARREAARVNAELGPAEESSTAVNQAAMRASLLRRRDEHRS
jgi:lipoic acid synthetase